MGIEKPGLGVGQGTIDSHHKPERTYTKVRRGLKSRVEGRRWIENIEEEKLYSIMVRDQIKKILLNCKKMRMSGIWGQFSMWGRPCWQFREVLHNDAHRKGVGFYLKTH